MSIKWYLKATESDDQDSPHILGIMYDNGDGVKTDREKAFHYYMIAAERGQPYAMLNVGVCYYESKGVKKDKQKALEWMRRAAKYLPESRHNVQIMMEELGR